LKALGKSSLALLARRDCTGTLCLWSGDARCIAALCHPATYWLTGNTLHVWRENTVG
jgi:hypothetical protein